MSLGKLGQSGGFGSLGLLGTAKASVGILLSASSFIESSAQTTAIGTLSVVGVTGTPTFTLTDTHSNAAQVAGGTGASLQAGSASSGVGSFNITVHVTGTTPSLPDQVFSISALPKAITLTLDSGSDSGSSSSDLTTNINTPQINMTFGTTPVAGDVINVKDGSTLLVAHTITGGEISGSTIQLGLSALADGAHSLTAQHSRSALAGAYSSAIVVTVDTVAPTLSSVSGVQLAQATATLSVSTNDGTGVLYVVATTNSSTPSAAQVKAGQDQSGGAATYSSNQSVSSTGAKTATATGISTIATYYVYWVHVDLAGNQSTVAGASWAQADITAPVLTSPAAANATNTTETLTVSTDTGSGTLYVVVTTSSTKPSSAQIQAGQDNTGSAAVYATNQAVSGTGSQSATATGLSLSTTYFAHFMHKDVAGNASTVATSSSWQTAAPPALTSPAAASATSTTETLTVSTNVGNGTLYVIVSTSATPPSVGQIQAGNDSSGSAAVYATNQAVSGTGSQSATATGLSAATNYYAYFQHKDSLNNNSTVAAATQNPWQTAGGTAYVTGDRRGSITVTSSGMPVGGGTVAALVDGSRATVNGPLGSMFFNTTGLNGSQRITFDYGSGNTKLVDEAKWYQDISQANGTWQWYGSTDASTLTAAIGSSFTLGGVAGAQVQTQLNGNATAYRAYILLSVSGSMTANAWLEEVEFKQL